MRQKIEVKLPDGQVIAYYSDYQRKEDVAGEVSRLFPLAQTWRRAVSTASDGSSGFSVTPVTSASSSPSYARRFLIGGLIVILCTLLLVAGDDIYMEIRYQILMYQLRLAKVEMITSLNASANKVTLGTASKPHDIKVLSTSDQRESSDTRSVVGEVQNTGNRSYEYIDVQVTFYNGSGTVVDTKHDYVEPSTLAPGEKASFKVWIDNDRKFTRYTVTVLD